MPHLTMIGRLSALAVALFAAFSHPCATALAGEYGGVSMIVPGMSQTELQSIMGPPDYIQVKRLRQAWQYCPRGRLFSRSEELFVTVWFEDGRVRHMRAYPEERMDSCRDFITAFRWEDVIDGAYSDGSTAHLGK